MKCTKCGAEIPANVNFCSECGQPVTPAAEAPVAYGPMDENMFYENFASKNTKSWVKATIIICFITAGLSLINLLLTSILAVIDIAFYLVIGILLSKKKKAGYPIAVAVYCGVLSVISLVLSGAPTGILALVVSIFAAVKLKKVNAAYEQYKITGLLPLNPID